MSKRDCKASWTGKLEHPETHILTLKILDMIGPGVDSEISHDLVSWDLQEKPCLIQRNLNKWNQL